MKYILMLLMVFSFGVSAEECKNSQGGVIKENCLIVGENPNLLLTIVHAVEREDNTPLPIEEIKHTKIYFKVPNEKGGFDWSHQILPVEYTALYIEKDLLDYYVTITTFDTGNRESKPFTPDIHIDLTGTIDPPKSPQTLHVEIIITIN